MIQDRCPDLRPKFRALAETIMKTKHYDAMVEYLGGEDALGLIVSAQPGPDGNLAIDQLTTLISIGPLLPEHREGKEIVDLLAA